MDNMVLLVVALIFVVSVVVGYIRGLLKIGLSLLSTVITMVIVVFLSPYVGDALIKYTPIDEMIEEKCMEGFAANMSGDMLLEKDLSGTALAGMSQEDLQKIEGDNLEIHGINAQAFLQAIGDIPLDQQIQQVGDSVLPDFVKEALLENNNNMIYEELGANNFWEYVASFVARMLMHVASFLVTFLFAIIIVRALMAAVDLIGELPILGTVNHWGGAAVGLLVALLLVWVAFLLFTVMYGTTFGAACIEQIENNAFLQFLYDHNPLLGKLISF